MSFSVLFIYFTGAFLVFSYFWQLNWADIIFNLQKCQKKIQVCGAKGPRPRYPRVWKTRKRIGTVSKAAKLVECVGLPFIFPSVTFFFFFLFLLWFYSIYEFCAHLAV